MYGCFVIIGFELLLVVLWNGGKKYLSGEVGIRIEFYVLLGGILKIKLNVIS